MAIWPNKFLSGEFRVFHGKMIIIWLWALSWKFGGKIKFSQDEIHTIRG